MKTSKLTKGFSLIEMVVYISILVFMLTIIVGVVFSVIRSDRVIKSVRSIANSAVVSLERISREIRLAESVVTGSSILGVHPGKLVLETLDESGATHTVEFGLVNGRLVSTEDGVETGELTEASARVTNLVFSLSTATTSQGVRTEMTIESGTSTHYRVENFYSFTMTR